MRTGLLYAERDIQVTENDIRKCQKASLDILLEFQQACERQGLQYYLTAGTLLGAIRHRGFIPWDDDIDVAMARKDYDRLAELCFHPEYFLQNHRTESHYPYCFTKLRKNGTYAKEKWLSVIPMNQGIYIDIFPLDICPDSDFLGRLFFKVIELLNSGLLARESTEFHCGYMKWYMRFLFQIVRRLPNRILFWIRESIRVLFRNISSGKRLCTVNGSHGYPREVYQREWFSQTIEMEFEGYMFQAPIGWDELLRNMYGDYRIPVREEGHFNEVGME